MRFGKLSELIFLIFVSSVLFETITSIGDSKFTIDRILFPIFFLSYFLSSKIILNRDLVLLTLGIVIAMSYSGYSFGHISKENYSYQIIKNCIYLILICSFLTTSNNRYLTDKIHLTFFCCNVRVFGNLFY